MGQFLEILEFCSSFLLIFLGVVPDDEGKGFLGLVGKAHIAGLLIVLYFDLFFEVLHQAHLHLVRLLIAQVCRQSDGDGVSWPECDAFGEDAALALVALLGVVLLVNLGIEQFFGLGYGLDEFIDLFLVGGGDDLLLIFGILSLADVEDAHLVELRRHCLRLPQGGIVGDDDHAVLYDDCADLSSQELSVDVGGDLKSRTRCDVVPETVQ